jgi:hypothetical protein
LYPQFSWEELGGLFLGPMAYLDLKSEGKRSMPGNQQPPKAITVACCGTRVIWPKLDCLKPNLQTVNIRTRRNDACNRRRAMRGYGMYVDATSIARAMPSEGIQEDEWAAYVTLDTYNKDVSRDCLRGASPRVTESQ